MCATDSDYLQHARYEFNGRQQGVKAFFTSTYYRSRDTVHLYTTTRAIFDHGHQIYISHETTTLGDRQCYSPRAMALARCAGLCPTWQLKRNNASSAGPAGPLASEKKENKCHCAPPKLGLPGIFFNEGKTCQWPNLSSVVSSPTLPMGFLPSQVTLFTK